MTGKKPVFRLFKVAKELNVGSSTLVEHLLEKGFTVENSPNEKLDGEMYDILLRDFASEKVQKDKAEQLREQKKEEALLTDEPAIEEEEILSAEQLRSGLMKAPEKKIPVVVKEEKEQPVVLVKAEEPSAKEIVDEKAEEKAEIIIEAKTVEPQIEKTTEVNKEGLKVIGKIDLDSFKKGKKKEEVKPETKAEPVIVTPVEETKKESLVEEVIEEVVAEETETTVVETPEEGDKVIRAADHSPRLTGLTIKGKSVLPAEKTKAEKTTSTPATDDDSSTKRKRRRKRKKPTPAVVGDNKAGVKKDPKKKKEEPSEKEVQEIIKATLADLNKKAGRTRQRLRRQKRDDDAKVRAIEEQKMLDDESVIEVTEFITANEFANLINVPVTEIITKCMELGLFVSINQRLEADVLSLIAEEYGFEIKFVDIAETDLEEGDEEDLEDSTPRPPIITVMGHVDHGKTSLLDYVRKTNVIAGEAGGITQHIGAYEVTIANGRSITFLDTPGHEAFTAMRARGAKATDVAIIVIAADDAVMPQTKEAINHAQAAGVPMVFAFNKMDKAHANAEKIKEQLAQLNILVEDWGGKFQSQDISAKSGMGIDELLEKVLVESDLLELKANPDKRARGTVIEAKLDKGRGITATLLVQNGTLKIGDTIVAGYHFGKVKALMDERGNRVTSAGPSTPVQVLGLQGAPQAGDKFMEYDSERRAKEIAYKRAELFREQEMRQNKHITLDEIARRKAIGDFKELNIILKGDVDGSIEALSDSLLKLSTEEVQVNIVHRAVGQISESDVLLATASEAIIIGFQVRPSTQARKMAENEGIDIRLYSIIYDTINDVRDALEGLLSPEIKEEIMGTAEIREVFKVTRVGTVAGCMVTNGIINRGDPIRLIREGIVIYEAKLASLKRFKDDVKEVRTGFECGMQIENYNNIEVGDVVESYRESEVKRKL